MDAGKYKSAIEWAEKGVIVARDSVGERDTIYGNMLFRVASCQLRLSKFSEAEGHFRTVLGIRSEVKGRFSIGFANGQHNLGNAVMGQGRLIEAQTEFKQSLALRDSLGQKPERTGAASMNSLGIIAVRLGNLHEAEFYFQRAADRFENTLGPRTREFTTALTNLAQVHAELGNFDRSLLMHRRALALRDSVVGRKHPLFATSLDGLADLFQRTEHWAESEPMLREVIAIREKELGVDNKSTLTAWASLSKTLEKTGKLDSAEAILKAIIPKLGKAAGPNDPIFLDLLTDFGEVLIKQNRLAEAIDWLDSARVSLKKIIGDARLEYLHSLQKSAKANALLGKNDLAARQYSEAQAMEMELIRLLFPHFSDLERQIYFRPMAEEIEQFAGFVCQAEAENPSLVGQLFDLRLATRGILFSASQKLREQFRENGNLADYENWLETRERLANLFVNPPDDPKKAGLDQAELTEKARRLEKKLGEQSLQFFQQMDTTAIRWQTIQAQLAHDEAAIEIIRFTKPGAASGDEIEYVALILTHQTAPQLVRFSEGRELETVIFEFYKNELNQPGGQPMRRVSPAFEHFWKPMEPFLAGKTRIFMAPDGIFHKLNPGTLRDESGRYLFEKIDFRQLTNLRDIPRHPLQNLPSANLQPANQKTGLPKTALLLGNPKFDFFEKKWPVARPKMSEHFETLRNLDLRDLPAAEREVTEIDRFLQENAWKSDVFIGPAARESLLKSLDSIGLIHLATHGFFLEDLRSEAVFDSSFAVRNPLLRSMLFFSGALQTIYGLPDSLADRGQDGILTALEVQNLPLERTGLVTLSACETGLGDMLNGEGVFGLQRAFRVAGARSLLMSLWNVDDAATHFLMTRFYENWLGGLPKHEALRQAQRQTMRFFPTPAKWGGFVLIGE